MVWKKVIGNSGTLSLTDTLDCSESSHESVAEAGLKLLTLLYGGKLTDRLNCMRYTKYIDLTATSTVPLKPERLPPTENAARFHIYRTHLQAVQWKTLMDTEIKPEDWGWKLSGGHFVPIATDLPAAPENLLTVIRCKCKNDTRRPCSTQTCTCMKHGLPCVAACKYCTGSDCYNPSITSNIFDDEEEEGPAVIPQQVVFEDDLEFDMEIGPAVIPEQVVFEDDLEFGMPWVDCEEIV